MGHRGSPGKAALILRKKYLIPGAGLVSRIFHPLFFNHLNVE